MIHLANLGSQSLEREHSFFEKQSVTADLGVVIASIVADALNRPKVASYALPNPDVFLQIASDLDFVTLKAFAEVSRGSNEVVSVINEHRKKAVEGVAFGKEQWLKFFNLDIGVEPTLPRGIKEILDGPCPTDPTKKVRDTHMLTLIPKGQTLKSLGELVIKRFPTATGYRNIFQPILDQLDPPNDKSYWVLMTRDVLGGRDPINGTRGKTIKEQNDKLATLSEDGKANYNFPTALEAVASILAHEARCGERLFSNNPSTYTRCQEKVEGYSVVVGGFASAGLSVCNFSYDCGSFGASGVWRWRAAEVPVIGPW